MLIPHQPACPIAHTDQPGCGSIPSNDLLPVGSPEHTVRIHPQNYAGSLVANDAHRSEYELPSVPRV